MSRVLVVDPSRSDVGRCRAALAEAGHDVVDCASGLEAQRLLKGDAASCQVVVVLWELLGDVPGPALVARIRGDHPNLPVLVWSGTCDLARVNLARAYGAQGFLLKPVEGERLRQSIGLALAPVPPPEEMEALKKKIVGSSPPMQEAMQRLAAVILKDGDERTRYVNVLLTGENGTGKELFAHAFYELGCRRAAPWVPVNVTALPRELIESELFGHEAGAFTGAKERRMGRFEEAGNGTLFLDEIGDLENGLQAKLLRAIEERTFRRVGGGEDIEFRAQLVCATNHDLVADCRAGKFRQDLYHRIATCEIHIPPLKDRGDDLWLLVTHFAGGPGIALSQEARHIFSRYEFPGNVRELKSIIHYALVQARGSRVILLDHLPTKDMERRAGIPAQEIVWPPRLFEMTHEEATKEMIREFDAKYLPLKLREAKGVLIRAAKAAGWSEDKTFIANWQKAGLGDLPHRGG